MLSRAAEKGQDTHARGARWLHDFCTGQAGLHAWWRHTHKRRRHVYCIPAGSRARARRTPRSRPPGRRRTGKRQPYAWCGCVFVRGGGVGGVCGEKGTKKRESRLQLGLATAGWVGFGLGVSKSSAGLQPHHVASPSPACAQGPCTNHTPRWGSSSNKGEKGRRSFAKANPLSFVALQLWLGPREELAFRRVPSNPQSQNQDEGRKVPPLTWAAEDHTVPCNFVDSVHQSFLSFFRGAIAPLSCAQSIQCMSHTFHTTPSCHIPGAPLSPPPNSLVHLRFFFLSLCLYTSSLVPWSQPSSHPGLRTRCARRSWSSTLGSPWSGPGSG